MSVDAIFRTIQLNLSSDWEDIKMHFISKQQLYTTIMFSYQSIQVKIVSSTNT